MDDCQTTVLLVINKRYTPNNCLSKNKVESGENNQGIRRKLRCHNVSATYVCYYGSFHSVCMCVATVDTVQSTYVAISIPGDFGQYCTFGKSAWHNHRLSYLSCCDNLWCHDILGFSLFRQVVSCV